MGCLALAGWQEEDASDQISKSSRCQRGGEGGREVLRTFRDGMVQAEPLAHGTRCISFPWCPEPNKPLHCCIFKTSSSFPWLSTHALESTKGLASTNFSKTQKGRSWVSRQEKTHSGETVLKNGKYILKL